MRRALVLACLAGCGPDLHGLVAGRHYREAVCAAHDGWESDRALVRRALDADAGLLIHVDAVRADQLAQLLGDAAEPIHGRARFVRLAVQHDVLPLDQIEVEARIWIEDGRAAPAPTWATLAQLTSEVLPPPHAQSTYLTGANVLRVLGGIVTAGAVLVLSPPRPGTRLVDASDAEYHTSAPRAHALFHALEDERSAAAGGTRTAWFFVLDAHHGDRLRLELVIRYAAERTRRDGRPPTGTCRVTRTASIELGDIDQLDATLNRLFGPAMRPLNDVTP